MDLLWAHSIWQYKKNYWATHLKRLLDYNLLFLVLIHNSRSQWPRSLRPLVCWDCGFEFRREHGCLSLVSVVFCQVEVSATGRQLVQRIPTKCGVSECDRGTSQRRPRPTRNVKPWGRWRGRIHTNNVIHSDLYVSSALTEKKTG